MVFQRFCSSLLGNGRIICGFKGKDSSATKVYANFLFSLNPETGSGCVKFNNLFSVAIVSALSLNIPPSLCLPALPMSAKENSYLALKIASKQNYAKSFFKV